MIEDIYFNRHGDQNDYLMVVLPGRGSHAEHMTDLYHHCCAIPNCVYVGITRVGYEWYPMPYSATDQDAAVAGIPRSRKLLSIILKNLHTQLNIKPKRTIITGFSAGGVMALDYLAHTTDEYLLGICHNGAILDSANFPPCTNETPLLVFHNEDDVCFDWHERYLPMKLTLEANGYNAYFVENRHGGHQIGYGNLHMVCDVLNQFDVPTNFPTDDS